MSFRPDHGGGDRAVALMATCFVVLGGALTCTVIALVADPQHPESTLVPVGGVVLGIVFLLWLLRDKPRENSARVRWGWLARRRKRKVAWRAAAKRPNNPRPAPPPAPPTVESIREITGRQNTWVPADQTRRHSRDSGTNQ